MKVLLDLNIWIDLAARPRSFPASVKIYRKLEQEAHTICFPLCGYTTVYYLIEKVLGPNAALSFMRTLSDRSVRLLTFGLPEVALAHKLQFSDHEDGCVAATALNYGCDFVVSRNLRDFKGSPTAVR